MLSIAIPGDGLLEPSHCVLDFPGTRSVDGRLPDGVKRLIATLRR